MKSVSQPIIAVCVIAALVLLAFSSDETPDGAPCPAEVTAWLIDQAVPFDSTDPTASLDDLESLRAIIGDARIVGLGEQTHGTKEFFEIKHRIFRFLVEEMGFRLLGFEADWCGLIELNACLLPDGPPIETAFRNLAYWTWKTEEVMSLLRWMRAFNESNPVGAPVQLVGLDFPAQTPKPLVLKADAYLGRIAPDAAAGVRSIFRGEFLSSLRHLGAGTESQDADRVEAYVAVLDPLVAWMKDNRDTCVAASSEAEYLTVLHGLELAKKELVFMATMDESEQSTLRDRCMAENATWWLEFLGEDTKMAIWAHNGHIARGLTAGETWMKMGQFLAEAYGENYLPIGFSFAEGTFTAFAAGGLNTITAEPLIHGCYEAAFQTTGLPRFILDLRNLEPGTAVSEWMHVERGFRAIGAVYGEFVDLGWDYPSTLSRSYDIIIHIETSTPTEAWF